MTIAEPEPWDDSPQAPPGPQAGPDAAAMLAALSAAQAAQQLIGHTMISPRDCLAILETVQPLDMPDPYTAAVLECIQREANEGGDFSPGVVSAEMGRRSERAPNGRRHSEWLNDAMAYASNDGGLGAVPLARYLRKLARQRDLAAAEKALLGAGTLGERRRAHREVERAEQALADLDQVQSTLLRWDLADEMMKPDPPPPEELIDEVFTRPSVNVVFGPPQSAKSLGLEQALLDLVGGGGCFFGHENLQIRPRVTRFGDPPDRVLWVFGSEDTAARVIGRARSLWRSGPHADKPVPAGRLVFRTVPPGVLLGTPQGLRWLRRTIADDAPTVLVCDTVASLTDTAQMDPNKAEHVGPFLRGFHELRDLHGITTFLVHHTRKASADPKRSSDAQADTMLGSQAWRALADGVLLVHTTDGDVSRVTLKLVKGKDLTRRMRVLVSAVSESGRLVPVADDGLQDVAEQPPDRRPGRRPKDLLAAILEARTAHPDGLPWADAHQAAGVSRSVWYERRHDVQNDLLRLGHVVVGDRLVWNSIPQR